MKKKIGNRASKSFTSDRCHFIPVRALTISWIVLLAVLLGVTGQFNNHPLTTAAATQTEDPHDGQPDHCSNAKAAPVAHKCECKKTAGACDVEDKKCKVYCRKNRCHCFQPACDS